MIQRFVEAVYQIILCILIGHSTIGLAGPDQDHESKAPKGSTTKPSPTTEFDSPPARVPSPPSPNRSFEGCGASPSSIAAFANGEAYDFPSMITYLSNPNCRGNARQIAQAALQEGVKFNNTAPFRFDQYAAIASKGDSDSLRRTANLLENSVPELLRNNPINTDELYPILGQLAILSPQAARSTLTTMIQKELYNGDKLLKNAKPNTENAIARDLASTLIKLGANEPAIASEFADSVEDLALMSQADSLAQIFRSLSAATTIENSLAPTFNLSASALNRGIQKSDPLYFVSDKASMTKAVFDAIQSSLKGKYLLEAGATELNEALGSLLNGASLDRTVLKKLWKDAIQILSETNHQTSLAQAVAYSLTPKMTFLIPEEMARLLAAGRNYPDIAGSIQANFLLAWRKIWHDLQDRKIKVATFNRLKGKYFEPLVAEILTFDPYLVDNYWLNEVTSRGLVKDTEVEKRFPKLVLAALDRRGKATQLPQNQEAQLEPMMSSMTENFAVLWSLSQTHVPALMNWVKKYEE